MDPLSVAASIVGILAATAKVIEIVQPFVSNSKDAPKIAMTVHSEVTRVRIILEPLKSLLQDVSTPSSPPAARASFIRVDHLVVIFTDGVLLFSELETLLAPLQLPTDAQLQLRQRLLWASKKNSISEALKRIQHFLASLSAFLNVLQCRSDLAALQSQHILDDQISELLEDNRALAARVKDLEDSFNATATTKELPQNSSTYRPSSDAVTFSGALPTHDSTSTQPRATMPSTKYSNRLSVISQNSLVSSFSALRFRTDLEKSRVYRRVKRSSSRMSFSSSAIGSRAWSIFSGLSLAEISAISVIALPLFSPDLQNSHHYVFGSVESSKSVETVVSDSSLFYESMKLRATFIQNISTGFEVSAHKLPFKTDRDLYILWNAFVTGHIFYVVQDLLKPASTGPNEPILGAAEFARFAKEHLGELGLSERESFAVVSETYRTDMFNSRPVIRMLNFLFDRHSERLNIVSPFDEKENMLDDDKLIIGESETAEKLRQFLKEERTYVNQLERLSDFWNIIRHSGEFTIPYSGDFSRTLPWNYLIQNLGDILTIANRFLYALEAKKLSLSPIKAFAEIFLTFSQDIPSHEGFQAYGHYNSFQDLRVLSAEGAFSRIRDCIFRSSPAMKYLVSSKDNFVAHLSLPVARFYRYLDFLKEFENNKNLDEQERAIINLAHHSMFSFLELDVHEVPLRSPDLPEHPRRYYPPKKAAARGQGMMRWLDGVGESDPSFRRVKYEAPLYPAQPLWSRKIDLPAGTLPTTAEEPSLYI
ncbi:hypothetical protein K458DRAFT_491308 [Lentithecium fluviatile CBS 122367]|uniref:DH domain-containing protein n=1 Tax=Lentithecium fluviatile CBS 122367 TaxID=1168545 RepID=A0A6G1IJI3_9PLEO|nr:hypothetical protein K458DRAFT_491308 [Lentithecium fluviatile CBS 122367]